MFARLITRPWNPWQAGLAIGKFVKEPFNEKTRHVMFGGQAKEMMGRQ